MDWRWIILWVLNMLLSRLKIDAYGTIATFRLLTSHMHDEIASIRHTIFPSLTRHHRLSNPKFGTRSGPTTECVGVTKMGIWIIHHGISQISVSWTCQVANAVDFGKFLSYFCEGNKEQNKNLLTMRDIIEEHAVDFRNSKSYVSFRTILEQEMESTPVGIKGCSDVVSTSTSNVGWPLPEGWIWKVFFNVSLLTLSQHQIWTSPKRYWRDRVNIRVDASPNPNPTLTLTLTLTLSRQYVTFGRCLNLTLWQRQQTNVKKNLSYSPFRQWSPNVRCPVIDVDVDTTSTQP